jgi:hypothetical protein
VSAKLAFCTVNCFTPDMAVCGQLNWGGKKKVSCNINHILISHSRKTQILYAVLETDVFIFSQRNISQVCTQTVSKQIYKSRK